MQPRGNIRNMTTGSLDPDVDESKSQGRAGEGQTAHLAHSYIQALFSPTIFDICPTIFAAGSVQDPHKSVAQRSTT